MSAELQAAEVGVPGDPDRYFRAGVVDALPSTAATMYAIYEVGDQMCVYRDHQWWCSPVALVVEVLEI